MKKLRNQKNENPIDENADKEVDNEENGFLGAIIIIYILYPYIKSI